MKRLLAAFLLCLTACGATTDSGSLTGTNVYLAGQPGWAYYSGADYPAGTYYHTQVAGVSNRIATVTLPVTLGVGPWYLFYKTICYNSAGVTNCQTITTLADAVSTNLINDRDWNIRWSTPIALTNTYETNIVTINFQKTDTSNLQLLMMAMYWTTNYYEDLDPNGRDTIYNYYYPSTSDTTVDSSTNVLNVSSFEAGMNGWHVQREAASFGRSHNANFRVSSDSYHGSYSLKALEALSFYSPTIIAKPNRVYNLSFYYKGSGTVYLMSAVEGVPTGRDALVNVSKTLSSAAVWTRTNVSTTLKEYPGIAAYRARFLMASNSLIDAVKLEEGSSSTAFSTRASYEIGLTHTNNIWGVYYTNETAVPVLGIYNNAGSSQTIRYNYAWYAYNNEKLATNTHSVTVAAGTLTQIGIPLPSKLGWFRLMAWTDETEPVEIACSRVPPYTTSATGVIGTHNYGRDWQVQGVEKLGISWSRLMSPDSFLRWSTTEPTDGAFTWFDDRVSAYSTNNTEMLANIIGVGSASIPAYAGTWTGTLDDVDITNHVMEVVSHYSPSISYWEIANEPPQSSMPIATYTNLLWKSATSIKAVDPSAKVVALGGINVTNWLHTAFDVLGASLSSLVDVAAIHSYPSETDPYSSGSPETAAAMWTNAASSYGIPLWNTESGTIDWGGSQTHTEYLTAGWPVFRYKHNSPYFRGGLWEPERMVKHAVVFLGHGFQKVFYYDSREIAYEHFPVDQYQSWEIDGQHRPKFVALAVADQMIRGKTFDPSVTTTSTNLSFYFFKDGVNSVGAMWVKDNRPKTLNVTNVVPADMWGNQITVTTNSFPIGRLPVYITGGGLSESDLKSALQGAVLIDRSDTTAPHVSICMFPAVRSNSDGIITARWSAVDDDDVPGKNTQTDIQTRVKLIGVDSDWSEWGVDTQKTWVNTGVTDVRLCVQAKDVDGNTSEECLDWKCDVTFGTLNVNTVN